jgi:hypothetical protein
MFPYFYPPVDNINMLHVDSKPSLMNFIQPTETTAELGILHLPDVTQNDVAAQVFHWSDGIMSDWMSKLPGPSLSMLIVILYGRCYS